MINVMAQASALGAALAIHKHWNTKLLSNDIIGLKYYSTNKLVAFEPSKDEKGNFLDLILIETYSATPKCHQLGDSIMNAVETGKLKKGDLLPSINELSYILEISHDTAVKGHKYLEKVGVILNTRQLTCSMYSLRTGRNW